MTPRERIYKVLKEKGSADRIPWSFNLGTIQGICPSKAAEYKKQMNIDQPIAEYLDYDVLSINDPDSGKEMAKFSGAAVGALNFLSNNIRLEDYYDEKKLPQPGYLDAWGIYHHPWSTDPTFEIYYPPLEKITDDLQIKKYPSPKIDPLSVKEAGKDVERIRAMGKASTCYSGSIYEWSWYMRGQQNYFMDIYDRPQIVGILADKFMEFDLEMVDALQEIGVDMLTFCDDFGTQNGLQISADHWRKYIKPRWKNIWQHVKDRDNTIIFLHSCGKIDEIIPDLIEMGLDVLHPIQPEVMDAGHLYKEYHKDLAFWGTISSQKTIPFGTPKDIEREIKERVRTMGVHGSLVISPSNIIGPEVPTENITAFWKACKKYCE